MPEGGRILVIGSHTADSMPFPGLAAYVPTKAAMQGIACGPPRDLGPRNMRLRRVTSSIHAVASARWSDIVEMNARRRSRRRRSRWYPIQTSRPGGDVGSSSLRIPGI